MIEPYKKKTLIGVKKALGQLKKVQGMIEAAVISFLVGVVFGWTYNKVS